MTDSAILAPPTIATPGRDCPLCPRLVAYREALNLADLDAISRKLIQRHYETVQAAHDRVRQLRDREAQAR